MRSTETRDRLHQDQAACPPLEACGPISQPGRRMYWLQWLRHGWGRPPVAQGQTCAVPDASWDSQHEQLRPPLVESAQDCIAMQSGPNLRMVMHHHLLLS
jgi:hypothetical protein